MVQKQITTYVTLNTRKVCLNSKGPSVKKNQEKNRIVPKKKRKLALEWDLKPPTPVPQVPLPDPKKNWQLCCRAKIFETFGYNSERF